MACLLKIKLTNIKVTFLILTIGNMMNLFARIIKDLVLKDMPIAMINMGLREILNYMNAMIVQNVH